MRMAILFSSFSGSHCFLSSISEVVCSSDLKTRLAQDLFPESDVSSFQTNNQRNLKAHFTGSVHHTTGDDVTLHDSTEDVHEDGLHVLILKDNGESFLNSFFR